MNRPLRAKTVEARAEVLADKYIGIDLSAFIMRRMEQSAFIKSSRKEILSIRKLHIYLSR